MSDFDVTDNSRLFISQMSRAKTAALEAIGLQAEGYAKLKCPVGTPESTGIPGYMGGTLRNSISHDVASDGAYIGTNVEYGPYVELGTVYMAARPYLKPAAADHTDEYKAIAKQYLQGA